MAEVGAMRARREEIGGLDRAGLKSGKLRLLPREGLVRGGQVEKHPSDHAEARLAEGMKATGKPVGSSV